MTKKGASMPTQSHTQASAQMAARRLKPQAWRNGEPLPDANLDRALMYGDGFFTSLLLVEGRIANWAAHQARLLQSQQRLGFPELNWVALFSDLKALVASRPPQALEVVKVLVTRGLGGRGYQPPEAARPVVYLQRLPFPDTQATSALMVDSKHWPLFELFLTVSPVEAARQSQLAGLKHLNRLDNVLARQALADTDFDEAIMLDGAGAVIGATQANLVVLQNGRLLTPDLTHSGVKGTCLQSLNTALAQAGLDTQVEEASLTLQACLEAESIFCCNGIRGIMPVKQFQTRDLATEPVQAIAQAWFNWQQGQLTDPQSLQVRQ